MHIDFSHSRSKIKALVDAISTAIMHEQLLVGDNLLSINDASAKYRESRDTVFKAYRELMRLGLIDSTPQKGYFVKGELNKILLLLDTYSPFKRNLYNSFVQNLPENFKVDLLFHQYNEMLFDTIIRESVGRYNMFVVMNFSNDIFSQSLNIIPKNKLLLLDFGNFEKEAFPYICQDFDMALYNCLNDGVEALKKFKCLAMVFGDDMRHPSSSITYFERFCTENGFESKLIRKHNKLQALTAGVCYLCIDTEDMVNIVKQADNCGLKLGHDIGVIVYNDDPVLEIIKGGISSISIDFALMGSMAAKFVTTKQLIQTYLPTKLKLRASV